LISPHDAFGTNLYAHVLRGRLMRIVPRENESINETWIADRDRFGFEGMYSPERVTQPMLRVDGTLTVVDWEVALAAAAEALLGVRGNFGGAAAGFLATPSSTTEELYLLARIARGLGSANVDHRLRRLDFRAQEREGTQPGLGLPIADIERLQGVLIVGSNLRHEMPMLAHRIRKAAVKGGARVAFLNPRRYEYLFPVAAYGIAGEDLVREFAAVVRAAAAASGAQLPAAVPPAEVRDTHRAIAAALLAGERRAVLLGTLAQRHPAYAELQSLAAMLAEICTASLGLITEGANAAGAYLAGAVPHRTAGGVAAGATGLPAPAMLAARLKAYVLFGGIDPAVDLAGDVDALSSADLLVALTTHLPESLKSRAHVVLPIGSFAETAGTFVNAEGRWQTWQGAAKPPGESRPGWKVLRVLANLLNLPGFDYASAEEVLEDLRKSCVEAGSTDTRGSFAAAALAARAPGAQAPGGQWIDLPPYQGDMLVRGSGALAKTKDGQTARTVL